MKGDKTYKNIEDARLQNKGNVIIFYPLKVGGQLADRWLWCAEKDGEVLDYHKRDALVAEYFHMGESVVVFTWHNDGTVSSYGVEDA